MYSAEQLSQITALFDLSLDDYQELEVGSRWMGRRYVVTSGSERFFLKVRSEWWPPEQAALVCTLLQELSIKRFPVPELCLTKSGECFALWQGHICECHQYVDGQLLAADEPTQLHQAGHFLACLHPLLASVATDGRLLPEGCGYPQPKHVGFFAERVRSVVEDHADATRQLKAVVGRLTELGDPQTSCETATVHGDYHPGNIIVCDARIAAVCDFDLTQRVPVAYDLGYFLYRTAGRSSRSEGGVAHLDRVMADAFMAGYLSQEPVDPPSRSAIAKELRRFSLYDCLLEGNNTGDAGTFEAWASDSLALEEDLAHWVESST